MTDEPALSPDRARRYARQLSLPQVGTEGQRRLLASTVTLVGVGGLGCPAALYLAAAGVGRLVLIDGDRVDASNLHRQVLYGTADEGRLKVEVAAERIRALNPDVVVETHASHLEAATVRERFTGTDLVLDGTDNFPARYLVNDACVLLGIPNAHGSIFRFEGQVSFFDPSDGPCFRCLHPDPPPPGLVPSCAEAGVLGALPGVVGTLQATEALKYLLGAGDLLRGRLLVYDALALEFRELRLRKDPACPVCGDAPTITEPADLEGYGCADEAPAPAAAAACALPIIVPPETVRDRLEAADAPLLVDVREDWEFSLGALPGALHIPMHDLPGRLDELPVDRDVVVYCHAGIRSLQVVQWLRAQGRDRTASLDGGTELWSARIDPSVPRY